MRQRGEENELRTNSSERIFIWQRNDISSNVFQSCAARGVLWMSSMEIYGINKKVNEDLNALKKEVLDAVMGILNSVDAIEEKFENEVADFKKVGVDLDTIRNWATSLKGYTGAIK